MKRLAHKQPAAEVWLVGQIPNGKVSMVQSFLLAQTFMGSFLEVLMASCVINVLKSLNEAGATSKTPDE